MFGWFKKSKLEKVDKHLIVYSPKEDITAYELSKCMEILIFIQQCKHFLKYKDLRFKIDSYPENIRRHFEELD